MENEMTPPDVPDPAALPPSAIPASPWGIGMLQSRTFVGAVVSAVFALIAAVLTLLRLFGAELVDPVEGVSPDAVTDAVVTITTVVSGIAGLVAAQGRLNGGRALSPINPSEKE